MDVPAMTVFHGHAPPGSLADPGAGTNWTNPHLAQTIADAVDALRDFVGGHAEIGAFAPPRVGDLQPDGMITLCMSTEASDAEIAIDFGTGDIYPSLQRRRFDRASFDADLGNPHACGLVARDLREAWSIVYGILNKLAPASIRLSFGA